MALPDTGGSYAEVLQPGINPLAVRKGIITDVFVRDYLQSSTNLADPSAGLGDDGYFTPYAKDGQVRKDLLVTADGPNLGFYHVGMLGADGISFDPNMDMEEVPVAQSLRPARVDITREGETFEIVALEMTPLVRYLVNEIPLVSVPDVGTANLTIPKPMEATIVERQFILFGFDGEHRFARTIPRAAKTNVAEFKWAREGKEGTGVRMTFMVLPCPYVNKPVLEHYDGSAWRALGGYPKFSSAPTASAVAGGKATVSFAEAVGKNDPFTYVLEQADTANDPLEWVEASLDGTPSIVGPTVTMSVKDLTPGDNYKFRAVATGTNQLSAVSLPSNEITALGP